MYGITTAGFESPAWLVQSGIHGWGLIARAEMKQDSMVVEYRGDLLRPKMSDDRQKLYNRIGKDCYLFNVNDDVVIDATMTGAVGRFTVRLSSSAQPKHPQFYVICRHKRLPLILPGISTLTVKHVAKLCCVFPYGC